jgi:transketolase
MEQKSESLREAFGKELEELGSQMSDLVVVGADTTESIKSGLFGDKFPERFFNVGIAEQNMVGVSSGLALYGKTVVCGTYMVFLERAIDQIRNTIAYCNLDVKIIGAHTGISVGPDGGSHQDIEDIAIMRALPNMKVVAPADAYSTKALVKEAVTTKGPFYIRLIRPNSMSVYSNEEIKVGKANVLRDGKDISIIACGIMVPEALKAAERLQTVGISASVIDCHTIKPIDESTIIKAANNTGRIITAEDHNIMGGLGSAVAEVLSRRRPTLIGMIGVHDVFGESGQDAELMVKYGISEQSIFEKAKGMVKP